MTRTGWTKIAMASLAASLLSAAPALAAKPTTDYFSAGSNPSKAPASPATSSPTSSPTGFFSDSSSTRNSVAAKWFRQFDEAIISHKATAAERVTLSRPFNQEAERVEQWTQTATQVAKRYRGLAKILKAMTVPATMPGVKDYRDLRADWYNDAAGIYEELIKPRPPAKTMEELDAALDDIKQRAQSLSQNNGEIKAMDMSLRKTFRVPLPIDEDALRQYVTSKK